MNIEHNAVFSPSGGPIGGYGNDSVVWAWLQWRLLRLLLLFVVKTCYMMLNVVLTGMRWSMRMQRVGDCFSDFYSVLEVQGAHVYSVYSKGRGNCTKCLVIAFAHLPLLEVIVWSTS